MITGKDVVQLAVSQDGDKYEFGHEVDLSDENPDAFDCSEIIQWVGAQLEINPTVPDGSWLQARHCKQWGTLTSIENALVTPGALLFKFSDTPFTGPRPTSSHVAISQGNGLTIEARGKAYGVGQFDAYDREWTHAGLIPGVMQSPDRWAYDAWLKAEETNLLTVHSKPHEVVTTQRLMVFLDRAGVI